MKHIPDLLNSDAQKSLDVETELDLLQYGFHTGESSGALRMYLGDAPEPSSEWEMDCFVDDIFIDELVDICFRITTDRFTNNFVPPQSLGFLKKVLCHPPRSSESVQFRQEIQKELAGSKALRKEFEMVYRNLVQLRGALDSAGVMGCEYSTRRRIDILLQIKDTVNLVARSFQDSKSGICRINKWAKEFKQSEAFELLLSFVDYEDKLSNVRLDLRVAANGSIRRFQIVDILENKQNPFYENPFVRFFGWFRLFLMGYRVGRDELAARLVEHVFDAIVTSLVPFLNLIGHMEFHLASLAFVDTCKKNGLNTCFPSFSTSASGRTVNGLFNPLLLRQDHWPVTCDVKTNRSGSITIITGPNSGGKTRLLQAIAILQILGQNGIAVPASSAELHFASGMFVSITEGSNADQREGRLGQELLRIRRLFEKSGRDTLVILDELCSGTNPSEGEEIFLLVVSLLKDLQPETFITTHFLRFARQLQQEQSELNLEFLQAQMNDAKSPTYKFVDGVAQTSLAGQIAERLGVTREKLASLVATAS